MQLFATRGYAVFFPDAPLAGHSPAADLAHTIMPGIVRLRELDMVDAERIGLMGHSARERSVVTLLGALRDLL